jgi:Tol biopolymer transport system component
MTVFSRSTVALSVVGLTLVGCTPVAPIASPSVAPVPTPPPSVAATARPATPAPPTAVPSTFSTAVGYPDLPGWIVFEHFGAKPDGTSTDTDFDNRMIWLVKADGSGLHELAPGEPAGGKVSPDISADGQNVAFGSWDPGLLYEVPIDGGDVKLLSADCSGFRAQCQEGEPAYSADGSKLAFVRFDEGESTVIGIRDMASGDLDWLEHTRVSVSESYVSQPSWSPAGDEIVYYRVWWAEDDERPTDTRVYVAKADGSGVRELPQPDGRWAADPDWSPDGSTIVFTSAPNRETEGWGGDGAPQGGIYTIRPDGTGLTELCAPCLASGWAPSWTADGRILFWGMRTFALMNPDGSGMAHINAPELTWFGDELGFGYAGFLQPTE